MKESLKFVVIVISLSAMAYSQSSVTGAISGMVADPSSAVIPSAMVTLLNVGTNKEEMVTSDEAGRFRFSNLQPGTYTLTIKTAGFADYKQEQIGVEVGRTSTVDVTLQLVGTQAEVNIIADVPLVNTETREFASNINQTAINELPINGRRWSNFV